MMIQILSYLNLFQAMLGNTIGLNQYANLLCHLVQLRLLVHRVRMILWE